MSWHVSHLRHLIPSHSSLATHPCFQTFWGYPFPVSSSRAQPRDLSRETLRSVSHKHRYGNNALVLRISAFTHPSFSGLQERFLASLEMTIRESVVSWSSSLLVPSHQSLVTPQNKIVRPYEIVKANDVCIISVQQLLLSVRRIPTGLPL